MQVSYNSQSKYKETEIQETLPRDSDEELMRYLGSPQSLTHSIDSFLNLHLSIKNKDESSSKMLDKVMRDL